MVQPIDQSYEPPKSYTEWPDGEYVATGIEFTSNDDENNPILKQQKNGRVARFNFMIKTKDSIEKGPNHGLFLYEFPMLGIAFGVQISGPPDDTNAKAVSDYLIQAKQLLEGHEGTIIVKDKWVGGIKGMSIAEDYYNFRIVDVVSKNEQGEKSWFEKTWPSGHKSKRLRLVVLIVTGNQGAPTPYKNARILVEADYGFEYDEKQPDNVGWEVDDNDDITLNAKRASNMYELTAAPMFDPFKPSNPHNLVGYWLEHLTKDVVLFCKIEANTSKKGFVFYKIDWNNVVKSFLPPEMLGLSSNEPSVVTTTSKTTVTPAPVVTQQTIPSTIPTSTDDDLDLKARTMFFELLSKFANGEIIHDGNEINTVGKEVAQKHLNPLKEAGKIQGVLLTKATYDDIVKIVNALIDADTLDEGQKISTRAIKEQLELALIGFDATEKEVVVVEDNPWG